MPSWPINLWPKINVYCYILRFWSDNCPALRRPQTTDKVPDILVVLSSTLTVMTLSRLLPGERAAFISPGYALGGKPLAAIGALGRAPECICWLIAQLSCTGQSYSMLVNTNHGSFISFSFMLGQFCFSLCFWLTSFSSVVSGWCVCCYCLAVRWQKEWLRLTGQPPLLWKEEMNAKEVDERTKSINREEGREAAVFTPPIKSLGSETSEKPSPFK